MVSFHIRLLPHRHVMSKLYMSLRELGDIDVARWLAVGTILCDSEGGKWWQPVHESTYQHSVAISNYFYCQLYEVEMFIL